MESIQPTLWTHYGCWQCPSTSQAKRPLSAIIMSGWAHNTSQNNWCVKVGIIELSVLLSKSEQDFLKTACIIEGLSCWLTGLVVMTNRTKLMVPDEINVYRVGPLNFQYVILSNLGQKLAISARLSNHGASWVDALKFKSDNAPRRRLHPLAMIAFQNQAQPIGSRPEISIGNFFATHMEAASVSRTCQLHPCTFTRLGSSDNIYDYEQNKCVILPPSSIYNNPLIVKGGFMIANLPATLVNTAIGIVNNQTPQKNLIICSRSSLVPIMIALDQSNISYKCITSRAEITGIANDSFKVALVTLEICETYYHVLSKATSWNRVVFLIGWPSFASCKFLKSRNVREQSKNNTGIFSCNLQLMLSLASDLPDDIMNNPPNSTEVAHILGLPENALGDFSSLRTLLPERVLKIQDEAYQPKVVRYSTHWMNAPSNEEIDEWNQSGTYKYEKVLFGQLATAGRDAVCVLPTGTSLCEFWGIEKNQASSSYLSQSIASDNAKQCAICMDDTKTSAITSCGHWYCPECIMKALRTGFKQCPVCREPLPLKKDVVVSSFQDIQTKFLEELSRRLKDPMYSTEKTIVLMSWGNTHERICRFLRTSGIEAVSWSGNAKQLLRNIQRFKKQATYLFADPASLTLKWLELPFVKRFLIIYPLDSDKMEVCCQLRDCLNVSPNASFVFLRNVNQPGVVGDLPTCNSGINGCPILLETKMNESRFIPESQISSPNQIEVEPIL